MTGVLIFYDNVKAINRDALKGFFYGVYGITELYVSLFDGIELNLHNSVTIKR